MPKTDPIRPTDDQARALARSLVDAARFAALGVRDPDSGAPVVTRVALVAGPDGRPVSLISDLSSHTRALRADPVCSLLVGEPGPKGDPLTHPRLTLQARAGFVGRDDSGHARLRSHYLGLIPKARLYVDFADFAFVVFTPLGGLLNGGFGKAFVLAPEDLARPAA